LGRHTAVDASKWTIGFIFDVRLPFCPTFRHLAPQAEPRIETPKVWVIAGTALFTTLVAAGMILLWSVIGSQIPKSMQYEG
jgi:hypothetical protein